MTPLSRYEEDLNSNNFFPDPCQKKAVALLDDLYHRLSEAQSSSNSKGFFQSLFQRKFSGVIPQKGLYFWGGVGRGKTYLMDAFYDTLPFEQKQRMHFHRFMYQVHERLKHFEGQTNPLKRIAIEFSQKTRVLCFDEFFVSDITDAMILATLLEALFAQGVTLVATSNIPPDELYRNGLQRARFLPAITLIQKHCQIFHLDAGIDYRLRTLTQASIYHFPLDDKAREAMNSNFQTLATPPFISPAEIEINHRVIPCVKVAQDVLHVSFKQLCDSPRSQNDYIEIAKLYHTVLLCDVPQLTDEQDDAARRLIALVDEFYERNVKLIISAAVMLDQIYQSGRLAFEFERCCSRLQEMQSHSYLAKPHLP